MNWVAPDNPICPFIVRENPEFGPLGEGGGLFRTDYENLNHICCLLEIQLLKTQLQDSCLFP